MAAEKATALVVRTVDWSETSRIATLWTREFGKVRVLAKGGRRLKSNFESALDLLTHCSIVLLRKSSGGLDLLTEARVVERFPQLRRDLPALYAGYYVAELLADLTEDYDPHPVLFDEACAALQAFGGVTAEEKARTPLRLVRFELVLLRELGYSPRLDVCALCEQRLSGPKFAFSAAAGGLLCSRCQPGKKDSRWVSAEVREAMARLGHDPAAWQQPWSNGGRRDLRLILGQYMTWLLGRPPRLLPYLGS